MDADKLFASPLHLKIIGFFHENQASIDTPRGIATWIEEDRAKVKKALEDLVSSGILVAHRSTSTTGYSYTIDPKLIARIGALLKRRKSSK
jgi:predicted transcriptional regulator